MNDDVLNSSVRSLSSLASLARRRSKDDQFFSPMVRPFYKRLTRLDL